MLKISFIGQLEVTPLSVLARLGLFHIEQSSDVVTRAHELPFSGYFRCSPQAEVSKSDGLFNDSKDRFLD